MYAEKRFVSDRAELEGWGVFVLKGTQQHQNTIWYFIVLKVKELACGIGVFRKVSETRT